jgi:N utilization substance protein A
LSIVERFIEILDVDQDFALVLIEEGIETLDDLAYLERDELLGIEGFDEDIVDELQERAKAAVLAEALGGDEPSKELLAMDGMSKELANQLAEEGIVTMEGLADLSVDELLELATIEEQKATSLIMLARAPWFK